MARLACTAGEITLNEIITAVNLIEDERGGIYWASAIEYKKGDVIVEDDTFLEAWVCIVDHTSSVGNNVNGAPSQPLSVTWDYIIPDPLTF